MCRNGRSMPDAEGGWTTEAWPATTCLGRHDPREHRRQAAAARSGPSGDAAFVAARPLQIGPSTGADTADPMRDCRRRSAPPALRHGCGRRWQMIAVAVETRCLLHLRSAKVHWQTLTKHASQRASPRSRGRLPARRLEQRRDDVLKRSVQPAHGVGRSPRVLLCRGAGMLGTLTADPPRQRGRRLDEHWPRIRHGFRRPAYDRGR